MISKMQHDRRGKKERKKETIFDCVLLVIKEILASAVVRTIFLAAYLTTKTSESGVSAVT